MKSYRLRYQVDKQVQPWMDIDEVFVIGEIVHEFRGCTYGCIGPNGLAVTQQPGELPFIELPRDALEEVP